MLILVEFLTNHVMLRHVRSREEDRRPQLPLHGGERARSGPRQAARDQEPGPQGRGAGKWRTRSAGAVAGQTVATLAGALADRQGCPPSGDAADRTVAVVRAAVGGDGLPGG